MQLLVNKKLLTREVRGEQTCDEFLFSLQSYRLQMTIENMNHSRFIPRKDYTANRLVSGILQLASNTSLVIDETQLEQGQLDTKGNFFFLYIFKDSGANCVPVTSFCYKTVGGFHILFHCLN